MNGLKNVLTSPAHSSYRQWNGHTEKSGELPWVPELVASLLFGCLISCPFYYSILSQTIYPEPTELHVAILSHKNYDSMLSLKTHSCSHPENEKFGVLCTTLTPIGNSEFPLGRSNIGQIPLNTYHYNKTKLESSSWSINSSKT